MVAKIFSEIRKDALRQLLLELEAQEGHPVSINYKDACYVISISEHINGHELFVVNNKRRTPWETFSRDLRNDIQSGDRIFGHHHGDGDFWLATTSGNRKPPLYELSTEFVKDRTIYLQRLSPQNKRKNPSNLEITIQEEEDENVFPEGVAVYRLHREYERNSKLVRRAKEKRKVEDPGLHCEICNFSFVEVYGELGDGFIEAHHTRPLSDLRSGGETSIEDLAMVCSNCHKMIHRFRPWSTISEIRNKVIQTRS